MKKLSPVQDWIISCVAAAGVAVASAPQALASAELDRQYALQTIGYLRAWDNVDGLFGDYVSAAYRDFFSQHSRFTLQDLSKADAVLGKSKIPYHKLIDDNQILGQLTRSTKSESVIRTKIYKEGPRYRFVIDWLHAPKMDVLASETFNLDEPEDGKGFSTQELKEGMHKALASLVQKVPIIAHVTGRDDQAITINIGEDANLNEGDTLVVGTLEEVKKHPLLNSIVDWRFTRTGRIQVDETDGGIAFCHVVEEEPGREVSKFQKVIQVIPHVAKIEPVANETEIERKHAYFQTPQTGWVAGNLWMGTVDREYSKSVDGLATGRTGSGLLFGGKTEGQVWLNREFFAEMALSFGMSSFTNNDLVTRNPTEEGSVFSSLFTSRFDAGYTYYATPDFFGPKGWVKLGYQTAAYSFPLLENEFLGYATFKGLFLGVGGDLPIRNRYGALLSLDFGISPTAKFEGLGTNSKGSANAINFYLGGYYRLDPRMTVRVGADVLAHTLDFENGPNLTHRTITFGPALLFYF